MGIELLEVRLMIVMEKDLSPTLLWWVIIDLWYTDP